MCSDTGDKAAAGTRERISQLEAKVEAQQAIIRGLLEHREHDRSENAQLVAALESSRQISSAIGILMATYQLSYDDSFGVLRRISQQSHRKLREVARDVLETGAVPRDVGVQPN